MKIIDKICETLGLYGDEEETEVKQEPIKEEPVRPMFGTKSWEDRQASRVRKERKSFFAAKPVTDDDKLISMPLAKTQVKVVVIEPINFDDAQKVADYLRKNQPVVVNFEDTDSDVMKRIVDFVSGTIYALNGNMKKIGRNIMVCAPQNVDIDAGNTAYGDRSDSPWKN